MLVLIDLKDLYGETAKLSLLPYYLDKALQLAGERGSGTVSRCAM
jgi:hypothetical protein